MFFKCTTCVQNECTCDYVHWNPEIQAFINRCYYTSMDSMESSPLLIPFSDLSDFSDTFSL